MSDYRSLPLTDLSKTSGSSGRRCASSRTSAIRPLVRKMDQEAKIPRDLIDACFELGIMGIEIPEQYRRRRRHLLHVGRSWSRSWPASTPRWRCWWTSRTRSSTTRSCAGGARSRRRATSRSSRRSGWGPTRSPRPAPARTPSRSPAGPSDKGDHYELTGRKLWITNAAEAELFIVIANADPVARATRASPRFLVERTFPGFTVGKKEDKLGIRASSTCELIFEELPGPQGERARARWARATRSRSRRSTKGRIGIGAQMVGVAQGAFEHALKYVAGAPAVRQADRRVPGRPVPARGDGHRDRGRAPPDLQRGPPAGRRRLLHQGGGHGEALRLAGRRARRPRRRSRSSAATASRASTRWRSTSATRRSGQIYEGTTNMQLLVIAKQLLGKL